MIVGLGGGEEGGVRKDAALKSSASSPQGQAFLMMSHPKQAGPSVIEVKVDHACMNLSVT